MTISINFWRQGHANNSSSTHNIIWTNDPLTNSCDTDFGWDHFTCSSTESKKKYVAICLYRSWAFATGIHAWGGIIPQEKTTKFLLVNFREWVGTNFPMLDEMVNHMDMQESYVDHQSLIAFPYHRDVNKFINVEFAKAFMNELVLGNYAILGGNDNEDAQHPDIGLDEPEMNLISPVYSLIRDVEPSSVLCEKDNKMGDFVLSLSTRGDIMRVSFKGKKNRKVKSEEKMLEGIVDHMEGK